MNPTEYDEQVALIDWLELLGLRFSAVPNSTYTTSWNQKRRNHSMGVRAGVPDLFVLIPPNRSKDNRGHLVWIELKRVKGGVVSPEQKEWIESLNKVGGSVEAAVAKGSTEAKQRVLHHLKDEPISLF